MQIRPEQKSDRDLVYAVNASAFPSTDEADLVNRLRQTAKPLISLVAVTGKQLPGHILFSPVQLHSDPDLNLMGLAPMAVLPEYQRHGVGSLLLNAGLDACQQMDVGAVVVLGHANYYPKFGFLPAVNFGIKSEYDVPSEVFMLKELIKDYLRSHEGTIRYHREFGML